MWTVTYECTYVRTCIINTSSGATGMHTSTEVQLCFVVLLLIKAHKLGTCSVLRHALMSLSAFSHSAINVEIDELMYSCRIT